MSNDFENTVKSKTKDELVRILVNKEEYKYELVDAATKELKKRDYEKIESPTISPPINLPTTSSQETPLGIILAGVLHFITGPIWLFLGFLQAGTSVITNSSTIGFYSIWNILVAIMTIVFGIGILKGLKWGYEWGLGTALINILWFGFLFMDSDSMLFVFLISIEIVVVVSLLVNKQYFLKTNLAASNNSQNNVGKPELDISKLVDDDFKVKLIRLNSLIQNSNKYLFGSTNNDEIRALIGAICHSKDSAENLLITYKQLFEVDLIEELKNLTNNYNGIKEYCEVFIDFEIVEPTYPHIRLN
jgi:hypothetical protein